MKYANWDGEKEDTACFLRQVQNVLSSLKKKKLSMLTRPSLQCLAMKQRKFTAWSLVIFLPGIPIKYLQETVKTTKSMKCSVSVKTVQHLLPKLLSGKSFMRDGP